MQACYSVITFQVLLTRRKNMLFGNDQLFFLVRSAKLGKLALPPVLEQLREWIHQEFGVHVVHIVFDQVEIGPSTGRPRLNVILETDADYNSWKENACTIRPDVSCRVLSQFKKLASASPEPYDTNNLFLTLDNFSAECLGRACNAFLRADANQIVQDFAAIPIWAINGFSRDLVVFLNTNDDIKHNQRNGNCSKISKQCFDAVKRYDEFDYLSDASFRLNFDSKENLDKNYSGSLFYYWR